MTDARHGKRAVHNWAQLPPEILHQVVANYLAYRPHVYLPSSWLHPDFHYQRAVFESIRDANDVQNLMAVCPQWHRALVNLDFWVAACRRIDRHDVLRTMLSREPHATLLAGSANTNSDSDLDRNWNHYRLISQASCIPCRINRPRSKDGIGSVKATIATAPFGQVPVCKTHRNNYFCGVCLKDYSLASLGDHGQVSRVPESLFENEDFDTWPTVHTTCFHCRRDALVRTVAMYSNPQLNLFEFLGGPSLNTKDYEARSAVDSFVDMAENGVNDVINVLLERHWLRTNTNLGSLLDQAVASVRYSRAELEDYESEEDEMLSDDEDTESYSMLQTQEELGGVRQLAIIAWARGRIMDGNWVSPGDIWCLGTGQVPADSQWDPEHLPPTLHPVPYSLQTSPSNNSASLSTSEIDEAISSESSSSSQAVHFPAPDCHIPLPNFRFAQGAANVFRGTFRDILLDPLRHIVARLMHEAQEAHQDPCVRVARMDLETVLVSLRDERTWYVNSANGARLMNAIPYVPTSTQNLPPLTLNLIEGFWREACAPLFQCQCSICDRAMRSQVQGQNLRGDISQPVVVQAPPVVPSQEPPRQIVLVDRDDETPDTVVTAHQLGLHPTRESEPDCRSRKRSSAELDDDAEVVSQVDETRSPGGTPRKRQRTGEKDDNVDDDAAMSSDASPDAAFSPVDLDSGGGTGPGSPTNSTGGPSETSLSSSSASDSSSLRSVASGAPLTGETTLDRVRMHFKELVSPQESVKVRGRDEETMYEDLEENVVYLH